jgi:beta-glucosidase
MKKEFLLTVLIFSAAIGSAQIKTLLPIDQKANALLAKMTLEEKVGQMTQLSINNFLKKSNDGIALEPHQLDLEKLSFVITKYKIGSILDVGGDAQTREVWRNILTAIQAEALKGRLKIPILYGVDAIRGNNYTLNSVLFPHEIAQAASFNPAMAKKVSQVSAYETRASFIPWTFSPVLDLGRQPMWPRIYETFGEDPLLAAEMGRATVDGFQGDGQLTDKYHVAACIKHYMGYSMPLSGHDRTPAWIPERELREYFLPPFAAAVKQGAKTVMVNSAEINGIPVHANKHILTDILKNELQFKGFVVSDYKDIEYLHMRHHVAKDNKESVMMAINAGIDMSMVPEDYTFCDDLVALAKEGKVPMSRINDAVGRILKVKFETGLFENPLGNAADYTEFNSEAHNKLNYDVAAECITLLKNNNSILPLLPGKRILVTGPTANTMRSLNGGWSRNWQGTNSNQTEKDKHTILTAIYDRFGADKVDYAEGVSFDGIVNLNEAVSKANAADVVVLCLGENSYTENPGNLNDINISPYQVELANAIAKTGKPIILVLAEGRPRPIAAIEPLASAVLHTYLLGNEGGNVIADALSGKINPSGKLPYTYPRYSNSLLNYYHKYTETLKCDEVAGYNPQWEFGFGLSYTTFKYNNLKLSTMNLTAANSIKVTVDVSNTGKVTGKETVLMYVSDLVASITPEVKRLRAFDKIELQPGETKTVSFTIDKKKLSFINANVDRVTEPGDFAVSIAGLSANITYK